MKALFNFFKKRTEPAQEPIEKIKLSFFITQDDEIRLKINWSDESDSTSDLLASLLYCLNKGLFYNKIIDSLNNEATNDNQINFIKSVLTRWNYLCTIELSDSNEPIVKPLEAFNANSKR